jgi:uncharacterized membrane protein
MKAGVGAPAMNTDRLDSLTDGVIAILIGAVAR